MKLAVDVRYHDAFAVAAGIGFLAWTDAVASWAGTVTADAPAAYQAGQFWRRELPPILSLLAVVPWRPEVVVIDAYVDLGAERPGLGRHLHDAVGIPVVGVAKTEFAGAPAVRVLRGRSARPLFVTAVGIDPLVAAARVEGMHGPSRIPALLAAADRLASHG